MPRKIPLLYLLSLKILMRHWHTCELSPAGLLLMSWPPCESTLSLSLPIILEPSLTSNVPIYTSLDI